MFISFKKSFVTICALSSILVATNAHAFDFEDIFSLKKTAEQTQNIHDSLPLNHNMTLKNAREKSKELQQLFVKGEFDTIEKTIDTEREKGYHTWNHGSATSFYLYYLSSNTTKNKNLLIDLEQSNLWIEKYPNSSYAYSIRGATYAQLGWDVRGTKYASDTPQHDMDKMTAYFKSAYEDLFKSIELDQKNSHAWRKVIQMSRYGGMSDERKKFIFKSAQEVLPNYYYTYYDYMTSLEPKWGGSEEELFAFARNEKFPEHIRARLTLEAHETWADLIGVYSYRQNNSNDWKKEKNDYKKQNSVKKEIKPLIEKTLKSYPKYAQLHEDYGNYLWYSRDGNTAKDKEKSLQHYSIAVDLAPQLVGIKTVYWLPKTYRKLRFDKKAAEYYEKYITAFPDDEDTTHIHSAADFTGWHHSRMGDFKRAEPFYKIVVDVSPESAKAQANYCNALYNVYKYDEGIKHCETAIGINAAHSWSYHILSQIYGKQGHAEKSKEFETKYKSFEMR